MNIHIHPHARQRFRERGATEEEVQITLETGERFPAKFGRVGFRRNFRFDAEWRGRRYGTKQIEAYAVDDPPAAGWVVVTVLVKFF